MDLGVIPRTDFKKRKKEKKEKLDVLPHSYNYSTEKHRWFESWGLLAGQPSLLGQF